MDMIIKKCECNDSNQINLNPDLFYDKLLFYWDMIEYFHNSFNFPLRELYKCLMKIDIEVICNCYC